MTDLSEAPALPSVYQAMAAVLADLPPIGKNDKAPTSMGGYSFRGVEDITAALKPLLGKHGVFIVPRTIERRDGERAVGQSKTMFVVDLLIEFTFYGPAGDFVVASAWGQGTDMGDKSPQKSATSALKTVLGQVFCIADAATDSERHEVPEAERPAPDDPDAWFTKRGWASRAEHDDARSGLVESLKSLPDEGKASFKAWRLTQKIGTDEALGALALDQFNAAVGAVAALSAGADPSTGEASVAGSGPVAPSDGPQAPATGDSPSEGDEDAHKPCVICGSTRSNRHDIQGKWRCSNASDCSRRIADKAEEAAKAEEYSDAPFDMPEGDG